MAWRGRRDRLVLHSVGISMQSQWMRSRHGPSYPCQHNVVKSGADEWGHDGVECWRRRFPNGIRSGSRHVDGRKFRLIGVMGRLNRTLPRRRSLPATRLLRQFDFIHLDRLSLHQVIQVGTNQPLRPGLTQRRHELRLRIGQ
jgi:hypothetical protein